MAVAAVGPLPQGQGSPQCCCCGSGPCPRRGIGRLAELGSAAGNGCRGRGAAPTGSVSAAMLLLWERAMPATGDRSAGGVGVGCREWLSRSWGRSHRVGERRDAAVVEAGPPATGDRSAGGVGVGCRGWLSRPWGRSHSSVFESDGPSPCASRDTRGHDCRIGRACRNRCLARPRRALRSSGQAARLSQAWPTSTLTPGLGCASRQSASGAAERAITGSGRTP